jgi:glycosyltransferase involved in cell wall biosynthesis
MTAPRVTIAFPTWRARPDYLLPAVEDALAQTHPVEVVIADDGSDAAVLEAAARLGARVVRNDVPRGLAGNWNRCVELAAGDYVHIMHQDDRMAPRFIERAVEALERYPRAGFAHTGWTPIGPDGGPGGKRWEHLGDHEADFFRRGIDYFPRVLEHTPICCPTAVFRREVFDEVGRFDERYRFAADVDMWLRILLRRDVVYLADRSLFQYRSHPESTTSASGPALVYGEFIAAKVAALDAARARRALPPRALRGLRGLVAREACRFARRLARREPALALEHLAAARRLSPGALLSEAGAVALLRAAIGYLAR